MKTAQLRFKKGELVTDRLAPLMAIEPQICLLFASIEWIKDPKLSAAIKKELPGVQVIGCSTAGEISQLGVSDDSCIITAVHFESSHVKISHVFCPTVAETSSAAAEVTLKLLGENLRSVFVLAPGFDINGSALVRGVRAQLPDHVAVTGGLAGDAGAFKKTYTLLNDQVHERMIVAMGIYGKEDFVGYGSVGGWKPFGPIRRVTRVQENILYELDGEPALAVYKKYLGQTSEKLPGEGLKFPLALLNEKEDQIGIIRTILNINEKDGSLFMAGEIPANTYLRLMHCGHQELVDGAKKAAEAAQKGQESGLGILISCVGRKLVMGEDTDDEIQAVKKHFGPKALVTGFYSNGEIGSIAKPKDTALHNQTMTITWLKE